MNTRKRARSKIDGDALRRFIREHDMESHLLTISQLHELVERAGLVPTDYRETVYRRALHADIRSVMQEKSDQGSLPHFFNVRVEETCEDGTVNKVQGYKALKHMTKGEWDQVIDDGVAETQGLMRKWNEATTTRNKYGKSRKWPQRMLPFPGLSEEDIV